MIAILSDCLTNWCKAAFRLFLMGFLFVPDITFYMRS